MPNYAWHPNETGEVVWIEKAHAIVEAEPKIRFTIEIHYAPHSVIPCDHRNMLVYTSLYSVLLCSTTVTHNREYKTNAVYDAHLLFFFSTVHTPLFYCQPDTIIGHSKMWCYLQRQTCFAKSTFSQILIVQPFPWFLKRDACDVHWFVIIFNHYFFALNLYIDIYELLCRT